MSLYNNILLISDLDGTLLNSQHQIDKENIHAIEQFVDQGGTFGIATGRTKDNTLAYSNQLPVNFPCILYNGGMTYDMLSHKIIRYEKLDHSGLYDFLSTLGTDYPRMVIQIYTPDQTYLISSPNNEDPNITRENHVFQYATIDQVWSMHWIKVILYDAPDTLAQLGAILNRSTLPQSMDLIFSAPFYLEFLPKDESKGSALQRLKSSGLADNKKIVTVGDYENDIRMIQVAHLGIAVQNACPALKAAANMETVSNDQFALKEIIERVIPHYAQNALL